MQKQADVNLVTLTGRIDGEPVMRVVPPGSTLYIHFELACRGEWPDHTGNATLLEYRHLCFAYAEAAEAIMWASAGDCVGLIGSIDMVISEYEDDGRTPIYKPAIRIHTMRRREER